MTAAMRPARADERLGTLGEPRLFGVNTGLVTDVDDPDGQGRVRVSIPWMLDVEGGTYETWCRLITPMAGADRGVWFVPDPGDEVAVVFEGGDPRRPYVLGALWNGTDAPPETMGDDNPIRSIVSRSGIRIEMDDTSGSVALRLSTPAGQKVDLLDGEGSVVVDDGVGNRITLDSGGITIDSGATVTVTASTVDVSAGQVNVSAGVSKFSGVVQADTVIANSVVSSSYTPGAGNIW